MSVFKEIIFAAGVFILLGVLMGLLLAAATKLFSVKRDERAVAIGKALPGANCGGCGYAGCSALAEAIARGEAKVSACTVGGAATAEAIAEIMGVEAESASKMRAFVMCCGSEDASRRKYVYSGADDCAAAAHLGGGGRACPDGCIGLGSCAARCPFKAIEITDVVAKVSPEKCVGCGVCVSHCPKGLIRLIPADSTVSVACSSRDAGRVTKANCDAGCIGCRLCVKACPAGAVSVENNLASIDEEKCTHCGACAEKCPRGVITTLLEKV